MVRNFSAHGVSIACFSVPFHLASLLLPSAPMDEAANQTMTFEQLINWLKRTAHDAWCARFVRDDEPHPWLALFISLLLLGASILASACAFLAYPISPSSCIYIAIFLFSFAIVVYRWRFNRWLIEDARAVDPSYLRWYLSEVDSVKPRLTADNRSYPEPYDKRVDELKAYAGKLERMRPGDIKEWDLLSLQQLLVDFANPYDLIGDARLILDELEEYANDSAYQFDREKFDAQRREVLAAIDSVIDAISATTDGRTAVPMDERCKFIDGRCERLRSAVRDVQEYIADYSGTWIRGSVTLSGLKHSCVLLIPSFLIAGLLPITTGDPAPLAWFNWSFVAVSGALTAVLIAYLKADETEIGHETSRREVSRGLIAAVAGFVSGALAYSFFGADYASRALAEGIYPTVNSTKPSEILKCVVWSFSSGVLFENFLNKAKSGGDN